MGRGPTTDFYRVMNENYVEGTLTCLKPEVIKRSISTTLPLVLNVEPTNACNSRCYYCPREKMIAEQGQHFMSLDLFQKIIDQIGEHKLIMLNLHKDGEPLMNSKLPEMVAYAKEQNAAQVIHLNTNGLLLNSWIGRGILEQGIDDITVSVDAAREETYQKLKKLKNLERFEHNIREALHYRDAIGAATVIRVKIMEFDEVTPEEIQLFHDKWQGVADEVQVTGVHSWSGAIDDFEITDEKAVKRYPCALLWYMLAVNSNGKVSVCNVDWNYSGVVGDIQQDSLHAIWNSARLKEFRRHQLAGEWSCPDVCEDCIVWVSVGDLKAYFETRKEFL